MAILVVAVAMLGLGLWIDQVLSSSITEGVATTAADSIEPLIAQQIYDLTGHVPLSTDERARLDSAFATGENADAARLLQVAIRDRQGRLIYESAGDLKAAPVVDKIAAAEQGHLSADVINVNLAPVGPLPSGAITVLRIYMPLTRPSTASIFATAELYFSARSVLRIEQTAQRTAWFVVALIGAAVILVLHGLVDRTSRTIETQRNTLAANLVDLHKLLDENRALHAVSEQLRINASVANENLLVRVGSDIHDSPMQLLTLAILQLTQKSGPGGGGRASRQSALELVRLALEELRSISVGLILPELEDRSLDETIRLAIERQSGLTGKHVSEDIAVDDMQASAELRICAYRVVQESLSNAFRHGDGRMQSVTARVEDDRLLISVTNSVGRRPATSPRPAPGSGLGLRSMRFRVESLGGRLTSGLRSPGRFEVAAAIPRPLEARGAKAT